MLHRAVNILRQCRDEFGPVFTLQRAFNNPLIIVADYEVRSSGCFLLPSTMVYMIQGGNVYSRERRRCKYCREATSYCRAGDLCARDAHVSNAAWESSFHLQKVEDTSEICFVLSQLTYAQGLE